METYTIELDKMEMYKLIQATRCFEKEFAAQARKARVDNDETVMISKTMSEIAWCSLKEKLEDVFYKI